MAQILLVQDDTELRELIVLRLEMADHKLTCAENGLIGLNLAMDEDFDLILMDMVMPVMDGDDALMQLRKFGYKNKIVVITAAFPQDKVTNSYFPGCDDVICKPITDGFEERIAAYF